MAISAKASNIKGRVVHKKKNFYLLLRNTYETESTSSQKRKAEDAQQGIEEKKRPLVVALNKTMDLTRGD